MNRIFPLNDSVHDKQDRLTYCIICNLTFDNVKSMSEINIGTAPYYDIKPLKIRRREKLVFEILFIFIPLEYAYNSLVPTFCFRLAILSA